MSARRWCSVGGRRIGASFLPRVQQVDGCVVECWRYRVKSMQSERVGELAIGSAGVEGDRGYALLDAASGRILSAKSVKDLLFARVDGDAVVLPDGQGRRPGRSGRLGRAVAWLGRDVWLATPIEGEERRFQMTFDPPNDDAEYVDIPAPAGSLLDFAPLHFVTAATLAGCRAKRPDLDWDVRRFRPNLVIDIDGRRSRTTGADSACASAPRPHWR